jgi:putative toxin-antitoxin system antitoxin component (TIGR02293 family)
MNNQDENIIAAIAEKTGFPESQIRTILTENEKMRQQAAESKRQLIQERQPEPYRTLHLPAQSRHEIIDQLNTPQTSRQILERFLNLSDMPNKTLADKVLEINPKTLHSYRYSEKTLPVRMHEHILKLEDLYLKGIELFENSGRFNHWLKSESYGLGNIKPISLIKSITGIDLVLEELMRIEYGATA